MPHRFRIHDAKRRALPADYPLQRGVTMAFPTVATTGSSLICTVVNQLLQNEWDEPKTIHDRQILQLRSLLRHTARNCEWYAERLRNAGIEPDELRSLDEYRAVPLLRRVDLQDHEADIAPSALPTGVKWSGQLSTSGSTGSPVSVRGTNTSGIIWSACNTRNNVWCNCDPLGTLASIRFLDQDKLPASHTPAGADLPHWGGTMTQCFRTGKGHAMHIAMDIDVQAAFLARTSPDYLLSYPTNLVSVGRVLRESGVRLENLKVVQTVSEVLSDERRREIEELFEAPVFDTYSCVETGYIASDCPEGHGYHVHPESVLVEVLDENDRPCSPGEVGRVVLTNLANYGFPLLRYDVGDYAVAGAVGRCACGRGLPVLEGIVGRQRGQLLTSDGRLRFSSPLSVAFRDAGLVRQFQVVQHERRRLEVTIVPKDGFGTQQEAVISAAVREYLGDDVQVDFRLVEHIPRTPGGKYLDFVCKAQ